MKTLSVPTVSLAQVVYRAVRSRKVPYNYCAACPTPGGGVYIQLATVGWLKEGATYINPHTHY